MPQVHSHRAPKATPCAGWLPTEARRPTSVGFSFVWSLVSNGVLRFGQPSVWGLSFLTAPLILSTGDSAGVPAILSMWTKSCTTMGNDFRTAPPVTGRRRDVMPLPVFIRGGDRRERMGRRAESAFGEWSKNNKPSIVAYTVWQCRRKKEKPVWRTIVGNATLPSASLPSVRLGRAQELNHCRLLSILK